MSEYTHLVIPKKLYEANTIPLVRGVKEWEVVGINYYNSAIQEYIIKNATFETSINASEFHESFFPTYEEAEATLSKEDTYK